MEHFRIAFWIVTLAGCLSARSIQKRGTQEGVIGSLRTDVKCADLTLYAPENMKKECSTKALNCYLKELSGPAILECEDPDGRINQALQELSVSIGEREEQTNSTECALACEQDAEVPFSTFVTNLETLFQRVNSED